MPAQTNGVLCVILLTEGEASKDLIGVLKQVAPLFERKMDRGSEYKFMWLDLAIEKGWRDIFSPASLPTVVVLNPGSRKRFIALEGEITKEAVSKQIFREFYELGIRGIT